MQIGFIGLGTMGAPMAEHLIAGGHSLAVFGGRRVPDSIRAKATVCKTIKEVAEKS
jgi:2-hydroxy-3-oxopropionate reductase